MADQDFKINIVTLADLTGIRLTQVQLDALQTAAAAGNKQAIAALKQLTAAQKEAEQAARSQANAQTQGIRTAASYGLIVGGIVAKVINDIAAEQQQVTKELDKQGAALVKNVQLWKQLADAASTTADVSKVGEKAIEQIDQIRAKFNEANAETLTVTQTIIDSLVAGFKNAFTFGGDPNAQGPFAALADEKTKGLLQDLASAQEEAARTVKRRLDEQRDAHEDIDKVIARESDHLAQQQALLRNLDPKTQLQSWVAVEQTVERIAKKLEQLNAQRQKQVAAGEPTTQSGLLGKQEQQLQGLLASGQLTPVEREAVSQQITKTREDKFQKDIADREKAFQKDIADRDKRFTTPPVAAPAGESTAQGNDALINALRTVMREFW